MSEKDNGFQYSPFMKWAVTIALNTARIDKRVLLGFG